MNLWNTGIIYLFILKFFSGLALVTNGEKEIQVGEGFIVSDVFALPVGMKNSNFILSCILI